MRRLVLPVVLAFILAAIACGGAPPKDAAQVAAKSALMQAYEARLDVVADRPGTCPEVVAAIKAEEAAWAPVWLKMNTNPAPPRQLVCP